MRVLGPVLEQANRLVNHSGLNLFGKPYPYLAQCGYSAYASRWSLFV